MGKIEPYWKRIHIYALCLLMVLCAFLTDSRFAYADETGSVTMLYPVSGVTFSLYKVGEWDGESGYTLEEPYASYGVDMNSASAANTLAAFVVRDSSETGQIKPVATGVTEDFDEEAIVTIENLEKGVYLVVGESTVKDGIRYTPQPLLVEIPLKDDSGDLEWDVIIESKYSKEPAEDSDLKVQKVWKSDDKEARPESITVQLLKDGKTFDDSDDLKCEVVLNEENNWSYEWKNLSGDYLWSVIEKEVPEGYVLSLASEDVTEVLENTSTNPTPPGNNPEDPTKPDEPKKRLPKTGQDWVPILFLTSGGLLLILIGLVLRRKRS